LYDLAAERGLGIYPASTFPDMLWSRKPFGLKIALASDLPVSQVL
jgi:hypothetical protein